MKLGIISDEDFAREMEGIEKNKPPPLVGEVIDSPHRGRQIGDVNVPESIRKIIGEESVINGREAALELAKVFGVSESSVSAYAKGATSTTTYHKPDSTLQNYLAARKNRLTKKSLAKLALALDSITPEKIKELKVRDASAVAKDMSVIAKNMEPEKEEKSGNDGPKFVVYAPTIKDERSYETIIVNDQY